jgi:hypothetical protein
MARLEVKTGGWFTKRRKEGVWRERERERERERNSGWCNERQQQ